MMWLALLACHPRVAEPPGTQDEVSMTADDFVCFRDWPQLGSSYYGNVLGDVEGTVEAATNQTPFPPGTIVQFAPVEAMVKHNPGFSPETGDWEFFKLKLRGQTTTIVQRGTTDIKNPAGGCADCHAGAAESNDWVCGTDFGCDPLPGFIVKRAEKVVAKDPRCP
jgi:hypothetical protein